MTEQEQRFQTYEMPIRFQFSCPLGHVIEGDIVAASWKPRRALCLHGRGQCPIEAQVERHTVEDGTVTFSLYGFCPFMMMAMAMNFARNTSFLLLLIRSMNRLCNLLNLIEHLISSQ